MFNLSLSDRLSGNHFQKNLLFSFLNGCISCLAMAPYNVFPVLIAGLSFLYIVICKSSSSGAAFALGWVFGFGYFLCGLWWIGNALLVEGNPYYWAWPLAVCGLPFILSFFPAFACLLAKYFSDLKKISGFLAFCAWMAFFEWARGHVFTGFPWNLYGHTWAGILPMLQVLSISNVYYLTWLTVLWCAAPGFLCLTQSGRSKTILAGVLILLFGFCLGFGVWRMQTPLPPAGKTINIHLVQANIPQSEKWNMDKMWGHFVRHLEMSQPDENMVHGSTYIVWAETALNEWTLKDPKALRMITAMLRQYREPAYLLTGILRFEPKTQSVYNSVVMIDSAGKFSNVYDKNHLVPFGEYIPFQKWIPLKPVARFKGFAGGSGPQTFATPDGVKYSPVVCYEIIFSGAVVNSRAPPHFILNVTNDSWYGISEGPWQHLSQAVFRAIEEGIPVVRVADTGVSAIIDPYGHIIEKSALFNEYEKTLALPGQIMVFRGNNLIREAILLGFLFISIFFGISQKRKI